MAAQHKLHGTGWSFPPSFTNGGEQLSMVSDLKDIEQSLQLLIATRLGERVMQPSYGCNLQALVFEPASTSFLTYLKHLVETAVKYYEARIELDEVFIDSSRSLEGLFLIDIRFRLLSGNSPHNFIYPYYLDTSAPTQP